MAFQTAGRQEILPSDLGLSLAEDPLHVLPVVPLPWLKDAFDRVGSAELERLRRYKIVPITWMPTRTITAVVDDIGFAEAGRLGLPVVGRVEGADFRRAFHYQFARQLVHKTTFHLKNAFPALSATSRVSPLQTFWGCVLLLLAAFAFAFLGSAVALLIASCLSGLFFCLVMGFRLLCLAPPQQLATQAHHSLDDHPDLPVYTVLVPLFRETRVLKQLVGALSVLHYPSSRLDIKLILEETDTAMHHAVAALTLPSHFDVIIVPSGLPQTKPRALDYALQFARGSLITIYDSEDIPQPDQLFKAALRFAEADDDVACLQARLRFFNPAENWLARQFSAEYAVLFEMTLPTLAEQRLPILLGGTSNHFRRNVLEQVGGWDPFNVTEDADLGLRMARMGYRAEMLDSITYEEANVAVGNWLKQRRRWLKGFLQTWLVHNRHPIEATRELGLAGSWVMHCMTLGVFLSALLHPVLVAGGIWCLLPTQISAGHDSPLLMILSGLNLFLLVAGYAAAAISMRVAMDRVRLPAWHVLVMTLPAYWILLSVAAWQSVYDFIFAPFHWHKTEHGLTRLTQADGRRRNRRPARTIYNRGQG